jgi:hypothetical protein
MGTGFNGAACSSGVRGAVSMGSIGSGRVTGGCGSGVGSGTMMRPCASA